MGLCMGGAWRVAWCGAWLECFVFGLVRLNLGVGRGLDGDGEEVVGVVSSMHGQPARQPQPHFNPT